jgi:hypothetical protein
MISHLHILKSKRIKILLVHTFLLKITAHFLKRCTHYQGSKYGITQLNFLISSCSNRVYSVLFK